MHPCDQLKKVQNRLCSREEGPLLPHSQRSLLLNSGEASAELALPAKREVAEGGRQRPSGDDLLRLQKSAHSLSLLLLFYVFSSYLPVHRQKFASLTPTPEYSTLAAWSRARGRYKVFLLFLPSFPIFITYSCSSNIKMQGNDYTD